VPDTLQESSRLAGIVRVAISQIVSLVLFQVGVRVVTSVELQLRPSALVQRPKRTGPVAVAKPCKPVQFEAPTQRRTVAVSHPNNSTIRRQPLLLATS
jgi:hypothetical protein